MKPIVKWQYEKLEGTLGLLEEHLADPDCPCHSDGENCARKHLKRAEDYAQETIILLARDPKSSIGEMKKLEQLAEEARSYRQAEERHLCGQKVPDKDFAPISWASGWRKYFETLLVGTCSVTARDSKPVIVLGEDTTWIRDVIAEVNKRWHGPAYRAYSGYTHGRDQTAGDVIRYEQDELGNDYGISASRLKYFDKFPAWAIRWVTKTREDAERYGDEVESEDAEGNLIIAEDGDEGYLVLDTSAILKSNSVIDPCKEARDAWDKYREDIKAGHNTAASFWKGQGEVYALYCAGLSDSGPACEIMGPDQRYLQEFFTVDETYWLSDSLGLAPEKERKIDKALEQLEEGIQQIFESDKYREYLLTLGKFHDYSLGNLILIWVQKQEATRVAGFNTWKDLGRMVKKGEKGIMILAPCFPPKGKREPEPEEEEEEETQIIERPVYFKVVYVFDISQTEGKEIPVIEVPVVQGEDSKPLFDLGLQYAVKSGIKILEEPDEPVTSDTMGYFKPSTRAIWVRGNVPQNQQTKSLFHELAHSKADDKYGREGEVLAESVAFAVCNHFGFDTGVRSFPYVALWAKDIKVLKQQLDRIRMLTKDIIEEVAVLAELKDYGYLEDFGAGIITGLGAGIGFKAVDYLVKQMTKRDKAKASGAELEKMMLLTKENRKSLPPLRATEEVEDPVAQVKFFTPWTNWTWFATEFDGEDEFYGLVQGHEIELGYFSLKELESVRGPFGLTIERDRYFKPTPLSKIRKKLEVGEMADEDITLEANKCRFDEATFAAQYGLIGTWLDELRERWENNNPWGFVRMLNEFCSMKYVGPKDSGTEADLAEDKARTIVRLLTSEICLGALAGEKDIRERAKYYANKRVEELEKIDRHYRISEIRRENQLTAIALESLGREVPAWLKEGPALKQDIEELADDYVLPIMKDWPGDKLTLEEIREYTEKFGAPPFTDEELIEALEYLQDGGEIMSFEKTAEKPKRWTVLFYEDSGKLGAKEVPKLIEVFKTTIVKHYRAKSAFHKKSFRVSKPTKDILIYLGCLKTHDWQGQVCSDNQSLHKTIVKKTDKAMKEVKKLEGQGIEVKYIDRVGVVPRVKDDILEEIAEALNQAETV